MHRKLLTYVVCISVLLGMTGGRTCAALKSVQWGIKIECKMNWALEGTVISHNPADPCKIMPCEHLHAILPEAQPRRCPSDERALQHAPEITSALIPDVHSLSEKLVLKAPSKIVPRTLYTIHCSLIC
jgi:hypothetical protein